MLKRQNPVAKHSHTYNKAVTHKDRRKALKRGYVKHKGRGHNGPFSLPVLHWY